METRIPQSQYEYIANDGDRTITFLNPPQPSEARGIRWYRDMERIQWFSIGYGYNQSTTSWIGRYNQEEYNCVMRYLNNVGWQRNNP